MRHLNVAQHAQHSSSGLLGAEAVQVHGVLLPRLLLLQKEVTHLCRTAYAHLTNTQPKRAQTVLSTAERKALAVICEGGLAATS